MEIIGMITLCISNLLVYGLAIYQAINKLDLWGASLFVGIVLSVMVAIVIDK